MPTLKFILTRWRHRRRRQLIPGQKSVSKNPSGLNLLTKTGGGVKARVRLRWGKLKIERKKCCTQADGEGEKLGWGIFGQELIIRPMPSLRAKNKFLFCWTHRGCSFCCGRWTPSFSGSKAQGQFDVGRRRRRSLFFSRKNFLFCFKASKLSSVLRGCYVIKKEICMKKGERSDGGRCCES